MTGFNWDIGSDDMIVLKPGLEKIIRFFYPILTFITYYGHTKNPIEKKHFQVSP